MTTRSALGYLLAFVPERDRRSALMAAQDELESDGDHEGVQACAALRRELEARRAREAVRADDPSRTWDGEGEG